MLSKEAKKALERYKKFTNIMERNDKTLLIKKQNDCEDVIEYLRIHSADLFIRSRNGESINVLDAVEFTYDYLCWINALSTFGPDLIKLMIIAGERADA